MASPFPALNCTAAWACARLISSAWSLPKKLPKKPIDLFRFHLVCVDHGGDNIRYRRRGGIDMECHTFADVLNPGKECLITGVQLHAAIRQHRADDRCIRHGELARAHVTPRRFGSISAAKPVNARTTAADALNSTMNPSSPDTPHLSNVVVAVY